ncbi:MAG: hypothetical protein E7170_04240 [Firmicutes bacterium]|nr:hypothetical protein [Bacillota bacterium]
MKIAINLEDIIKDNNFVNISKELLQNGNKIYLLIDREYLHFQTPEIVKQYIKELNINFTDAILFNKENELELLNLKNIGYLIDSNVNIENEVNMPIARISNKESKTKNVLNFNNSNEIHNNINEYIEKYKKHIEDPITVMSGIPSIDKVWTRQYNIDQMNVQSQNMSVYDYVKLNNKDNMDSVALRYFGKPITFKEMFDKIDEFARTLKNNNIKQGDVVTICMPNTPEGVIAFFATNKIGATASMLHPLLKGNDILDTLEKTNSKYMVMADTCYKEVSKIADKTNLEKIVVVSPADSMPILDGIPKGIKILYTAKERFKNAKKRFNLLKLSVIKSFIPSQYTCIKKKIANEIDKTKEQISSIPYNDLYIKWADEIKNNSNYDEEITSVYNPESIAVLLRTGGTTGTSKLAALTNENINNNASQVRDSIPPYKKGDELLAISPIFHGFGLVDSVIAPLSFNMSVDLHPQYNKSIFVKSLLKNKPTLILGVPTLFKSLISNPAFDGQDLSFLTTLISGGDTLDEKLKNEINTWLKEHNAPNPIFSGIGLTEAAAAIAFTGVNSEKELSVGFPLPLNNIKIINPETEQELGYGEVGELCIKGPSVMAEYYKNEEETKHSYLDENMEWLRTGDMCYLAENGEICFIDRNKNMIIVSGVNVYSNEIEAELLKIPEIDSCAVIGIPHSYKMNVPKAYVTLRKGFVLDEELKAKIMHTCNSKLDKHHQVYELEQIEKIPLTPLNKINYNELRNLSLNKLEENDKIKQR